MDSVTPSMWVTLPWIHPVRSAILPAVPGAPCRCAPRPRPRRPPARPRCLRPGCPVAGVKGHADVKGLRLTEMFRWATLIGTQFNGSTNAPRHAAAAADPGVSAGLNSTLRGAASAPPCPSRWGRPSRLERVQSQQIELGKGPHARQAADRIYSPTPRRYPLFVSTPVCRYLSARRLAPVGRAHAGA